MGLEPVFRMCKSTAALGDFCFCSSFRSSFGIEVEKLLEFLALFLDILLADFGVNLSHGGDIGPAAGAHGYLLGDAKMIGEGSEGSPQAVDADFGQTLSSADPVDRLPDLIWVAGVYQRILFICFYYCLPELGEDERDRAPGRSVFVLFPMYQGVVLALNSRSVDVYAVIFKVYIRPFQRKNLRTAQAGEGEKGGDFTALSLDGREEYRDLFRCEEWQFIRNDLRQTDVYFSAGGVQDHGGQEAPGVLQGFGGTPLRFLVYGALPLILGCSSNVPAHRGLEAGAGNGTIAPDGGWRENVLTG